MLRARSLSANEIEAKSTINSGTVFLSSWMTMDQINELRGEKVFFEISTSNSSFFIKHLTVLVPHTSSNTYFYSSSFVIC